MTAPLLQVQNLTTKFHTSRGMIGAVDNVSLHVDEGEAIGVVGESGSGKSVTALSMLRLVPMPGRIEDGSVSSAAASCSICPHARCAPFACGRLR